MRTTAYIDGFNLYYGALRRTSWKWLDLEALLNNILQPHHNVDMIKYFTARVREDLGDPEAPKRQDIYLRALKKHRHEGARVEIHEGHFANHSRWRRLVEPIEGIRSVEVWSPEEKGSDVNLAVHLVNDAWLNAYDCAVVVSNDGDIAGAIELVKKHHDKRIELVLPLLRGRRRRSKDLCQHADFISEIRRGEILLYDVLVNDNGDPIRKLKSKKGTKEVLAASQLPDEIPGTEIRKPDGW